MSQSIWTAMPRTNVSWRWDLMTRGEQPLGTLDGVTGGRIEQSIFNTVRAGGQLAWAGTDVLDWAQFRVQPWYTADTPLGPLEAPLGVFLMNAPATTHKDAHEAVDVTLYDKLLLLDQRKVTQTFTVDAGAVVTTALRTFLADYSVAIDDSTETLSVPMSWPAGTTYLRIANDLLAAINYFSLFADGYGVFQAQRYYAPLFRPVSWSFEDTGDSVYAPDFSDELDLFEVPNVVIGIASSNGDAPALISTARNDDPLSPTSTVNHQESAVVEENIDATSQAVLDAIVQRRLVDLSQKARTIEIQHAYLPIDLNDAVTFVNARRSIEKLAVVQSMTFSSGPGDLVTTRLLEVQT